MDLLDQVHQEPDPHECEVPDVGDSYLDDGPWRVPYARPGRALDAPAGAGSGWSLPSGQEGTGATERSVRSSGGADGGLDPAHPGLEDRGSAS